MKQVLLAVVAGVILSAAVVFAPSRANASDTTGVMAVINGAVASFNKGDAKTWESLCTSPAYIISNIPPYQYSTTCAAWWSSHAASSKKNGVSDELVTLGKAWHINVAGDRAYAAFPATYAYKAKGKTVETSGVLTVALQKNASGWLMTGWTWSAH
ncbi:MAG: hypothetical protein JO190_05525 [Candidatus Eremiobacteraeota bacterium]|nr:hypothetical protein [Candidatus Eremiobacteraeota bacterium]MBV8498097.1 hypothetical protein [Candidatus Eremiobacteraeota bacterium]